MSNVIDKLCEIVDQVQSTISAEDRLQMVRDARDKGDEYLPEGEDVRAFFGDFTKFCMDQMTEKELSTLRQESFKC